MAGQVNPALMRALMMRMGMGAGPEGAEGELGMDLRGLGGGGQLPGYRGEDPRMLDMPPREVMDPAALNIGDEGVPGMDLRGVSPALQAASQRRKAVASKGKKDSKKKG